MTYKEFLQYNETNKNNNANTFRISKIFNNNKTCMLTSVKYKNVNPSIIDIVHVVSEVRMGNIAVTNPSKIRNWKWFHNN